jgi:hypothetical protein
MLALSGSRAEKLQSPAATEIPVWVQDYQKRMEQARLEYQQLKAIEFPDEAEHGQGELHMADANSNLVQKQLSELAQQVVNIMQACKEEKEVLEDEFESLQANIQIPDTRVHTDKH